MTGTAVDASPEQVKKLRELTGSGIMDCKRALAEAKGNLDAAKELLRKRGLQVAEKKSGRSAKEGQVFSYIHHGAKVGVLVEINCETDFVARNSEFQNFGRDVAMQIAAAQPLFVSRDEIDPKWIEREKEIFRAQVKDKPTPAQEQILKGKLEKRFEEVCLLDQKFIRDDKQSIRSILTSLVSKLGENVVIKKFCRFEVGSD